MQQVKNRRAGKQASVKKSVVPGSGPGRKKAAHSRKEKIQLHTKEAYDAVMKEIDALMRRGEKSLSKNELNRMKLMAAAAELYEDTHDPLPLPESLADMIRMRMFQLRLNQAFTAKLLGVSDAKFSLILSGRQRPDIAFVKAVHEKLNVDANLLLQVL